MLHDQKSKELKPLPCGAFKRQVLKMYPKTPENIIKDTIHYSQVLCNPHLSEKKLRDKQWLSRRVLEKIIEIEGPPSGYEERFSD